MAQRRVVFNGDTTRQFIANHKRGSEYNATIANDTDQSITITVANERVNRGETPTYAAPAAGTLTIAAGANGALTQPYVSWLITAAAAATGNVNIVEAG